MDSLNSGLMRRYLKATKILDYAYPSIQALVEERKWNTQDIPARIKGIYNFVRDEMKFGYNIADEIPASQILNDGYGQCNTKATFCGFGVYTDNFEHPPIEWNLNNTFIQDKGINQDFGVFDTPDAFYAKHQQKLNVFKKIVFRNIVRHRMNDNVEHIRNRKV